MHWSLRLYTHPLPAPFLDLPAFGAPHHHHPHAFVDCWPDVSHKHWNQQASVSCLLFPLKWLSKETESAHNSIHKVDNVKNSRQCWTKPLFWPSGGMSSNSGAIDLGEYYANLICLTKCKEVWCWISGRNKLPVIFLWQPFSQSLHCMLPAGVSTNQ